MAHRLDPLAAARGLPRQRRTDAQAAVERPRTVDARGAALTMMGAAAAILLARYMQDVLIPFVLAGLVFYALDPIVDRLQRWHVPRALGAALAIVLIVGASVATVYSLRDDAMGVVEELPVAAQKIRAKWTARRNAPPTALEKVQEAARELEATAAAAASPAATPRGVERVQIEEPTFRASAYLWWTSLGAVVLVSQAVFVLLLAYFLLVYDDLFKRKLVENVGPHFGKKKLTVQILNDIAWQIERFMLVQILTCTVVGVVTWLVLWWMGLQHPCGVGPACGRAEHRAVFRSAIRGGRAGSRRLSAVRNSLGSPWRCGHLVSHHHHRRVLAYSFAHGACLGDQSHCALRGHSVLELVVGHPGNAARDPVDGCD